MPDRPPKPIPFRLCATGGHNSQKYDDCEGDLLSRVRKLVGNRIPFGAELGPHSHLTPAMGVLSIPVAHSPARELGTELIKLRGQTTPRFLPVTALRYRCASVGKWDPCRVIHWTSSAPSFALDKMSYSISPAQQARSAMPPPSGLEVKSKNHFRAEFEKIAKQILYLSVEGALSPYTRI